MTELNSADYYAARERREREMAAIAGDPAIADIHRDMAQRYADLVLSAQAAADHP